MIAHPTGSSQVKLSQSPRIRTGRFAVAYALGALLVGSSYAPVRAQDWPLATPAEAGFADDLAGRIETALQDDFYTGVHSVVLVRRSQLVYERYRTGDDEIFGREKHGVVFGPDLLHDVRSITKSVVSLLYGIALQEETVPATTVSVLAAFPEYADLAADPARAAITIDNLLSMTVGTQWDEDLSYDNPNNSEIAMNEAPDNLRFALEQPLTAAPGETWTYNGGATEVLGELIARGNGGDLQAFAQERLFGPLGIERFEWITDYFGRPHAASGLRLRPRDTVKIGQLVLNGGQWNGEQLVPAVWIEVATTAHADAGEGCHYGYQWWLCTTAAGHRIIEGSGYGGQQLLILPELDLVFLVNAGLYGDPEGWKRAYRLLEDIVIPSIVPQ